MANKKSKKDKKSEKNFEYEMLGNTFLGQISNVDGETDNSLQNLVMSMESDNIQKALKSK